MKRLTLRKPRSTAARGRALLHVSAVGALLLGATRAGAVDHGPQSASVDDAPPYSPPASSAGGGGFGVGVNPAALLNSALAFDVQIGLSRRVALLPMGTVFVGSAVKGGGGGLGAMIFPLPKRALHGFYVSPRLLYLVASQDFFTPDVYGNVAKRRATAKLVSAGATLGYQFNWGFMLRLGGGVSYATLTSSAGGADFEAEGAGFEPELLLGAAF